MKTPPLLLGAALLFWGWQADFLVVGAIMAVVLEGARVVKARWEFSDEDFGRICAFCSFLMLAALLYAFTANEGPAQVAGLLQNPNSIPPGAALASARTATALFRWLPMIFFLFAAAQAYSSREEIPWTAISLILRRRWERAQRSGQSRAQVPAGFNVGFPYFGMCLFAASSRASGSSRYLWGLCVLLAWALWSQRSRRFRFASWLATFALAAALGYAGQQSVGRLQGYLTRLNVALLLRFFGRGTDPLQSVTALGQIGRIKNSGRIVIRLQPEIGAPPVYLREASYTSFRSPIWSAKDFREGFKEVNLETNGTQVVLLPGKTNDARIQVACYLEGRRPNSVSGETEPAGLLPLPTGSARLENLPAFALTIDTNSLGAVQGQGLGLVIFDACFGPGITIDSPPGTNDLFVSPTEQPTLDRIITELPVKGKSTDESLQIVNGFFQSRFSYSIWQEPPKGVGANGSPLSRFLLETRRGHCEFFATATVLLLRQLQIPARYAVGYAVHEASGKGYVVRQRDAHAWCLVWDDRTRTWQDFDTTPASWVNEESQRASAWQRLSDLWSWAGFQFSKFRWGQTHLRKYLLLALAPVLALLLYRILFRRKGRRRNSGMASSGTIGVWPGLDSEFYLLEKKIVERGAVRRPNEPLSDWLRRSTADPALAEVHGSLQALLRLHYRYRFDPLSLEPADRRELKRGTEQVLETLPNAKVEQVPPRS